MVITTLHPEGYYQPELKDLFVGVEYEYFEPKDKVSSPNIGEEFINPYMLEGSWVKYRILGNPALIRGCTELKTMKKAFYRMDSLRLTDFKRMGIKVRQISSVIEGTKRIEGFRPLTSNPLLSEVTFVYDTRTHKLRVTCWDGEDYISRPKAEQLFCGKVYTNAHLLSVMKLLFE